MLHRARRHPAETQRSLFPYCIIDASVEQLIAAHILNWTSRLFPLEVFTLTGRRRGGPGFPGRSWRRSRILSFFSSKGKWSAGVKLIIQSMCSPANQLCQIIQSKAVLVLHNLIKFTEKVNQCFITQIVKFKMWIRIVSWTFDELSFFLSVWESKVLM